MFTTSKKQRQLNEQDREWHLSIHERAAEPHASGRVIRINSSYLEMVDGIYANRGGMSAVGLFGLALISWFMSSLWISVIFDNYLNPNWERNDEMQMILTVMLMTMICVLYVTGFVLFYRTIGEWFRYTHYPMRFNRRNRMVYVFRGDGTVLEAPWDKVYFTLRVNSRAYGVTTFGICGLVLKNPKTVEEMFVFGYASSGRDYCRRHWEFIRRYMEEGPQAVINAPGFQFCLPIADKRETLYQGWIALTSTDASYPFVKAIMSPFHVLFFIGRLVHRATSKVPLWPADVEAACQIDPRDPYLRDSSSNPESYR